MPPAKVQVARVTQGTIRPQATFVGTVTYPEVAEVASEVSGIVEAVYFEEGQRIAGNSPLIRMNADLLQRSLEAAAASHREVLMELEKTRIDLKRNTSLYQRNLVGEQVYDEVRFRVKALESKAAALKAETDRLQLERQKKAVYAPFDGVVVQRSVDRGEWIAPGTPIATLARDDLVDVLVDVPEAVVTGLSPEMSVPMEIAGHSVSGELFAVVPKGDVATRTFPLKVRLKNTFSLIQGMEARVHLPSGEPLQTFLVPRDAVISLYGQNVVFTTQDSKAHMLPVKITGYEGMLVGIAGDGLEAGLLVVVKGNERLREGQAVHVDPPQSQS
jgi:RND family efflux transporter MFP subunit